MKLNLITLMISTSIASMTLMATDQPAPASEPSLLDKSNIAVASHRKGIEAATSRKSGDWAETQSANPQSAESDNFKSERQSSVSFRLKKESKTAAEEKSATDSIGKQSRQNKQLSAREKRQASPVQSNKSHDFDIYDARVFLLDDIDGDGFFSEFQLEFDADTVYTWAEVYAKLYVSYQGGPWELYYTTDVFEINGAQSSDDYRVTTVLNYDFPTGDYDILIDLYEYGYSGIVATYSSADDVDLYRIPLEDREHEASYSNGFWFYDVTTDLLDDNDNDGFYHRFAMSFDVDTEYASADVFAEVYFLNEYNQWELEYTTDDINLNGNSTLDTVHLEFDWSSGYPTGYYDFKIVIRDAYSNERLIETYSEFGALNSVPLESYDRDNAYNSGGNSGSSGATTNYESGGGSLVWSVILMLSSLAAIRRKQVKFGRTASKLIN